MNTRILLFALLVLLGLRCVNSEILEYIPETPENFINSSVFISILDVDGQPVEDAMVQVGGQVFVTDRYGACFIQESDIPERAYVTADKAGYFQGSRRFYPQAGEIHHIRITLMEKDDIGSFTSSIGGQLSNDQKSSLTFPSEAIVYKDGTPYQGVVHVKGFTIFADDPALSTKMPGILEGRNLDGELGILSSYGMMAVEMQTPAGEVLEVGQGKQVEMQIEVPENMRSGAPQEIPMWHFDEEKGEWEQEGTAQFDGTSYKTQVSHFSIWNCDIWDQSLQWNAHFVDAAGEPLPNLFVRMTIPGRQTSASDYTNSYGSLIAYLPVNERIKLDITSECGSSLYSQEIGPYADDINIGAIIVNIPTEISSVVTGLAVDCNEQPIKNGTAITKLGYQYYVSAINSTDGSFRQNLINCEEGPSSVVIYDHDNDKRSEPKILQYNQNINAGTVKVCDALDEFITLEFKGFEERYLFLYPAMDISPFDQRIRITVNDVLPEEMEFSFSFDCDTPGPCEVVGVGRIVFLPNGLQVNIIGFDMVLTAFGPVGGYIQGVYTGVVNGGGNGTGGSGYTDISGEFSILRTK